VSWGYDSGKKRERRTHGTSKIHTPVVAVFGHADEGALDGKVFWIEWNWFFGLEPNERLVVVPYNLLHKIATTGDSVITCAA
jgi:hypothetical protein